MPNKDKIGTVTRRQLEEIARMKMPDITAGTIEAAMKTIEEPQAAWESRWRDNKS